MSANNAPERQFVLPLKDWALISSHCENEEVSVDGGAAEPDASKIKHARLGRIALATVVAKSVLGCLIRRADINDLLQDLLVPSHPLQADDIAAENFAMCFCVDADSEFLPDSTEPIVLLTASKIIEECSIDQIKTILQCSDQVGFISPQLLHQKKINADEKLPGDFFHKLGLIFYELFMPRSDPPSNSNSGMRDREHNDATKLLKENSKQNNDPENCQSEDEPGSEKGRLRRTISSSCKNFKSPHLSEVEISMQQKSIPVSICRLVSDLIHAGKEDNETTFLTLQDVFSELDQIIQEPNIFLKEEYPIPRELTFSQTHAFGRESELMKFLEVMGNVQLDSLANTNNIILVGGEAGSGKSHLLKLVKDTLSTGGGLCIHCKFDRLVCNQPLSTLSSAFDDYFRKLARSLDQLEEGGQAEVAVLDGIRLELESIERHLTTSGLVFLGGLIPSFRSLYPDTFGRVVIDEDDSVSGDSSTNRNDNQSNNDEVENNKNEDNDDDDLLGADNSRNRLRYLFRRLIMAMSSPERPLSIFIDDLHWADATSLSLLSSIMTEFDHLQGSDDNEFGDNTQGLVVAASYRTETLNEVFHDFAEDMEIASTGVRFNRIILTGIHAPSINEMVSDALKLPARLTRKLSEEVYEKTVGSPLFVKTFLSALIEEGVLTYSLTERRWKWDIHEVRDASIGSDVAEVITQKLTKMPDGVRDAIVVSSCFGRFVDVSILNVLDDSGAFGDIMPNMENAVLAGVIHRRESTYSFPHDLVKQAAYELLKFDEIQKLHFKIGLELVKGSTSLDDPELNPITYEAIQQFVMAANVEVSDPAVQRCVALLLIKASNHAVDVADFSRVHAYVQKAKMILGNNPWRSNFDLSLQIHENAIYAAYLNAPQQVPSIFAEILNNTTTIQNQIKSRMIWIRYLVSNGQLVEAVDAAFGFLDELGEGFPREITPTIIQANIIATRALLDPMSEDDFFHAPKMGDDLKHWCMMVMDSITTAVFMTRPHYIPLLGCRMVQMSIQHGLCQSSLIGFCVYSVAIIGLLCDIDEAYRIAKLTATIADRFNATKLKPKLFVLLGTFVKIWVEPLQLTISTVKEYRQSALLVGDQEFSIMADGFAAWQNMMVGYSLHSLEKDIAACHLRIMRFNQFYALPTNTSNHKAVLLLTGSTNDPFGNTRLLPVTNEDELLQYVLRSGKPSTAQAIYFNQMIVAFFFKKFEAAAGFASKYHALGNVPRFQDIYHVFYQGLIAFRLCRSKEDKSSWLQMGKNSIKRYQGWINHSLWNFENKLLLLEAELHFCKDQHEEAVKKYAAAIESARRHKFVNEEGLAYELSSLFYKSVGNSKKSRTCLENAIDCYKKWGADGILDLVGT